MLRISGMTVPLFGFLTLSFPRRNIIPAQERHPRKERHPRAGGDLRAFPG
jgi:hypothetical protein